MRWRQSDTPGDRYESWWVNPDGIPSTMTLELGDRADEELRHQRFMFGWSTDWRVVWIWWRTWWVLDRPRHNAR